MKRIFYLILLLLVLTACQSHVYWWRQEPDSYVKRVERWTRQGHVYQGIKTILLANATYLHPDVCDAYIRQYAQDFRLTELEKDELAAKEKGADNKIEFIISVFSDEEDWNNLLGNSVWTVRLVDKEGRRVSPASIDSFSDVPIYIRNYYPINYPYDRVYRFVFNVPDDFSVPDKQSPQLQLEFLSAAGHLDLYW